MTTIPERLIHPWFYENLKHTLNLNTEALGNCLLASYNTGVTKLLYYDESFVISQMNALPHLETPDRWKNRTYT